MSIFKKIKNRWKKLRLQPIRVYCLHHVCEQFDSESMNECDWMYLEDFKSKVLAMQQSGVRFISLTEAHHRLRIALSPFALRLKHYAVITFDDGYASLKEILPWLKKQGIYVTLFINGKYTDGVSCRHTNKEKYLTWNELMRLDYDLLEIGYHGWEHFSSNRMTIDEFEESLDKNMNLIHTHCRYIPFYAYPYGNHTKQTNQILTQQNIIPVYMDGMKNYNNTNCIHRELL